MSKESEVINEKEMSRATEYEVEMFLRQKEPGTGEFIFPGEPEFRYLWIKRSIQNLDQNRRRLQ